MDQVMTCFAEGNEIVRAIPASLARLDVMHIQDQVFRLALTPLASMVVTKQYIFPHIPETELRSLLVFHTLDLRISDLLQVKLCYLNGCLAHW